MRCDDSNNVYISKELEKVINVFNKLEKVTNLMYYTVIDDYWVYGILAIDNYYT